MRKKTITDEEMRNVSLDGANIRRTNIDAADVIYNTAVANGASELEANAATGLYLRYIAESLLNGLEDPPSVKEIQAGCGNHDAAILAFMSMSTAKSQIEATRTSIISGSRTRGNRTNHPKKAPVLCEDLIETLPLPDDIEDISVPFR